MSIDHESVVLGVSIAEVCEGCGWWLGRGDLLGMTHRKKTEKNEPNSHIELIAILTAELLETIKRFYSQNARAPAFFVALGMRSSVG